MGLSNDKWERFCNEYLIDLNATRAYMAAYPKCKTERAAAANASRLLTNANVMTRIRELQEERSKRVEVTQDMVIDELRKIAFSDVADHTRLVNKPMIQDNKYVVDPDTGKIQTYPDIEFTPTDKLTDDQRAAIASIELGKYGIKVKSYDKVRALELLGKHLGMFVDRPDQAEEGGGVIILPEILEDADDG